LNIEAENLYHGVITEAEEKERRFVQLVEGEMGERNPFNGTSNGGGRE